jgi:SAM-dependent methyltransferase
MKECSKSIVRRLADSRYMRTYFTGDGIDIGGKPDPLTLYADLFPLIRSIKTWDWEDGDAQFMAGVPDEVYDFVFASHCLEHLVDPMEGLRNWFRILKPHGHIVLNVPDEDLYEQRVFPSRFNRDHKTTWTVHKQRSWSNASRNIVDIAMGLGAAADIRKIEVIDAGYRYGLPDFDQTLSPVAESAIELIVRKRSRTEINLGYLERIQRQPSPEVRRHLNQYVKDQVTMKNGNAGSPPFLDESEI